jgi:hypothetical protein
MAKRKSIPVRRYPWARHHYKEGSNGYDRGCHACNGDAEWTIDWEYVDTGERWRGAVCAVHDPGPLPGSP